MDTIPAGQSCLMHVQVRVTPRSPLGPILGPAGVGLCRRLAAQDGAACLVPGSCDQLIAAVSRLLGRPTCRNAPGHSCAGGSSKAWCLQKLKPGHTGCAWHLSYGIGGEYQSWFPLVLAQGTLRLHLWHEGHFACHKMTTAVQARRGSWRSWPNFDHRRRNGETEPITLWKAGGIPLCSLTGVRRPWTATARQLA